MKTIITAILSALLLLAVVAALVWLLPVRVTLFIFIVLQLLMLVALGNILNMLPNRKTPADHEQE